MDDDNDESPSSSTSNDFSISTHFDSFSLEI